MGIRERGICPYYKGDTICVDIYNYCVRFAMPAGLSRVFDHSMFGHVIVFSDNVRMN